MILYFDFDGTIADTAEGIARAIALAFEVYDLSPPSLEAVKGRMGFPLSEILASLSERKLSQPEIENLIQTYRKCYHEISGHYISLFEGMGGVVKECAAISDGMAIVTNKASTAAAQDVQNIGLSEYFNVIVGSDMVEMPKPAPDPLKVARNLLGVEAFEKGLVIGDSSADIQMAKADGLPSVGVTWGSKSFDVLKKAGATYLAKTPQELLKIVQTFKAAH
ncbi:HAD family hydrolase [Acetobacteraceae bacterium]|nr:HAD family hydrolase [Acetobacteraceae bacterium]